MSLLIEALKQAQARKKPKPGATDSTAATSAADAAPVETSGPSTASASTPPPTTSTTSPPKSASPELSLEPPPTPSSNATPVQPSTALSLEPVVIDDDVATVSTDAEITLQDEAPRDEPSEAAVPIVAPETPSPAASVARVDDATAADATVAASTEPPLAEQVKPAPASVQPSAPVAADVKLAVAPPPAAAIRTGVEGTASPQQTAQALLQAAKSERLSRLRGSTSSRRSIIGLALIVALIAGLGGAYWYFSQPTSSFNIPPPSAAESATADIAAEGEPIATSDLGEPSGLDNEADALNGAGDDGDDGASSETVVDQVKQSVQSGVEAANAAVSDLVAAAPSSAAETASTAALTPAPPPTPAAFTQPTISIEKGSLNQPILQKVEQPTSPLQEAYAALNRGDLIRAEQLYNQALSRHPKHPDALLGLATIADQRGLTEVAQRRYREVLHADPGNPIALSAVLGGLQVDQLPTAESDLRTAISRYPDQAALYFALGNVMSQRQRWPEAQQAYFEAATRDPTHPDYAFNLAVALDRLAKPDLAARFYRQALQLMESRPASFAPESARRRVTEIESTSLDVGQ